MVSLVVVFGTVIYAVLYFVVLFTSFMRRWSGIVMCLSPLVFLLGVGLIAAGTLGRISLSTGLSGMAPTLIGALLTLLAWPWRRPRHRSAVSR